VIPGAALEWNLVSASGVSDTWSLCWMSRLSMCEMRMTSVSVGQSMNAHGTSGFEVEAAEEAGMREGEGLEVVTLADDGPAEDEVEVPDAPTPTPAPAPAPVPLEG
jgi:hypothetical protein